MPLNLWYCHANNLITIDGHLWMCAVLISALYAVAAVVLKDELFVYVFSAGVAMTGLLFLADMQPSPQRFWEIASPATMLVVLGLIGIHLERAFGVGDGPFTREKFGMAFFWSGHVQLACRADSVTGGAGCRRLAVSVLVQTGLSMHCSACHRPSATDCGGWRLCWCWRARTPMSIPTCVVRKRGIFIHIAAFTVLWAEVLIVQILNLKLGVDAIIAILAVTSLLSHLAQLFAGQGQSIHSVAAGVRIVARDCCRY